MSLRYFHPFFHKGYINGLRTVTHYGNYYSYIVYGTWMAVKYYLASVLMYIVCDQSDSLHGSIKVRFWYQKTHIVKFKAQVILLKFWTKKLWASKKSVLTKGKVNTLYVWNIVMHILAVSFKSNPLKRFNSFFR